MKTQFWRHLPWLAGLCAAPFLFGSITHEGQAVVGLLFAASVFLLGAREGGATAPVTAWPLRWAALFLLVLPLIPLPAGLVGLISPERLALAKAFPVEPGDFPRWLPLTTAPAGSVQRLWELGLIITCFCLARYGAAEAGLARWLAMGLGAAVFLLAAADVWFRLAGQKLLLGIWENRWNYGAGTFANRNHFSGWLYVAILFCSGWLLRRYFPLQGSRSGALSGARRARGEAVFLGLAVVFGLVMAAATGSRGGFVACVGGTAVWVALLAKRSRRRKRWAMLLGVATGALLLAVVASEFLFNRMAQAHSTRYFASKTELWRQAGGMALKFPMVGTGWGSFVTAFNHYKQTHGDNTIWHAENELVQLAVESGMVGCTVLGALVACLLAAGIQFVWHERMAEPELCLGAVAGLAAFLIHAQVEFVFQVTANALLAAALLGFLVGSRDAVIGPQVRPPPGNFRMIMNFAWALALTGVAVVLAVAQARWDRALLGGRPGEVAGHARSALAIWPWAAGRCLTLAQAEFRLTAAKPPAERAAEAEAARQEINQGLRWDPLNWRLRLERAWLGLAFSTNTARAREEAWEVIHLNPLQSKIPMQFARQMASARPGLAMEFVRAINRSRPEGLREALTLAWSLNPQAAALWSLTPDTEAGLTTLGDFALEQGLGGLAAQAYRQLSNRVDGLTVAAKLLKAHQPLAALEFIPLKPANTAAKLLRSRACLDAGRDAEAIGLAEAIWSNSHLGRHILEAMSAESGAAALRERLEKNPKDSDAARRLAELLYEAPAAQRNLELLRDLARRFPELPRLLWMVFQTEVERHEFHSAALSAVSLAAWVAERE